MQSRFHAASDLADASCRPTREISLATKRRRWDEVEQEDIEEKRGSLATCRLGVIHEGRGRRRRKLLEGGVGSFVHWPSDACDGGASELEQHPINEYDGASGNGMHWRSGGKMKGKSGEKLKMVDNGDR